MDGYRGVYHRARIRATRWLRPSSSLIPIIEEFHNISATAARSLSPCGGALPVPGQQRHSGMVRQHQTRNLEIPGSMLRIAPE